MYCINCGVKLADSEKQCPLCGTMPFHPDIARPAARPLYPTDKYPGTQVSPRAALIVVTTLMILPMLITFLVDRQINAGRVTWSGYVIGALAVAYVILVLPYWFKKPNPVIFVPCGFAAVGLYLLYISVITGGSWFLSFAFPVTGGVGLITTALVTLLRYVKRGQLYTVGGTFIALGLFMPVVEMLLNKTFGLREFFAWSFYPLAALGLLGGMLIFLAINRGARERMERKFFI